MDLRTFAAGFGRVSFIGDDKFTAQCPAHDDEGAALQVRQEGARQRMLCARRCSATAILEARNLRIGGGGRARSLETEDDVECSTSESTSYGLISIRAVTVEDSVGSSSSSAEAGALPASGTSPQGAPNGNGWGAPRTNGNGTHANSNGHVPTPTFRRLTLAQWQNQLLALAMKQLKDDPEYQKPIAGEDMLEPLCADLEVGLEALVAYGQGPPSDLTAQ